VSSTLSALGTKAGENPEHRFRSLAPLLDRQLLGEAFRKLKRRAAPGIDGVMHGEYAENLEENLLALGQANFRVISTSKYPGQANFRVISKKRWTFMDLPE
jgi:hypothetical protein